MSLLTNKRILIVEDTTIAATYLARELAGLNVQVVGLARSDKDAVDMAAKTKPHLILMDIHLADGASGIDAARAINARFDIPIVYTTSYSDDETLAMALKTSPYGYVVKPFNTKTIKVTCETALRRFALESQAKSSEKSFLTTVQAAQLGVDDLCNEGETFEFEDASSFVSRFGGSTEIPKEEFVQLFDQAEHPHIQAQLTANQDIRQTICVDPDKDTWIDVMFNDIHETADTYQIGSVVDVTARKRPRHKLRLSNLMLKQLAEGVATLSDDFTITQCNAPLAKLLKLPVRSLIGKSLFDLGISDVLLNSSSAQLQQGVLREKLSLLNGDGDEFPAMMTISALTPGVGSGGYIVTISDITELNQAEKKLEALAFTDALTGTGNRNYMKLLLNDRIYQDAIHALVFIDLDGFKSINDTYGHDIGDEVLCECATRLGDVIREEDTLIRHGGDEFVVLVQHSDDLQAFSERLLAVFEEPISVQELELNIGASIGIAESALNNDTGGLLKRADIAMYEAKKQGKNQVVFYSESHNDAIEYRLFVEQGLLNALTNHELYATYQPIVNTGGDIVALEALCRWRNQDMGDIHPSSFIPIAEETGLINELGLKMLREVCIARTLLKDAGLGHIKVHLNVSILQLNSNALVSKFVAFLHEFDISAEDIVLEVTESAMHDVGTRRILRQLAAQGFTIAVDDFGSGFASVAELTESYTHIVKLDKSLMPGKYGPESKRVVVDSLIQLCSKLGKSVLLEGIETTEQADFARHAGCDLMQGFYYHRPVTITELISAFHQQASA
ncbi:GGDEF domain-containing response regulator [Salinimonas sediminis]|uniref:EAL domain-containing protein n=1 Tax=Salinimonas sediminis TaxID=2303538 RepID=A0A346NL20_9ALTE|nr:EAL domain-containing protein [Salinimonas sediminis]AXR06227.1 EAL domain-containing protein [Salinimonas sediminis]